MSRTQTSRQRALAKHANLIATKAGLLRFGNHKLGDDTAIFNMSTAKECPSRKRGLCEVCNRGIKCYAFKAEQRFPKTVTRARENQKAYWKANKADKIAADFIRKIERRRKRTSFLRFNESGDFETQSDVTKLSVVAGAIKDCFGIITYGYTARRDLSFERARFLVKGSGHDKGNNGRTTVIGKDEEVPKGYIECPGGPKGCERCNLCKVDTKLNIAFRKH